MALHFDIPKIDYDKKSDYSSLSGPTTILSCFLLLVVFIKQSIIVFFRTIYFGGRNTFRGHGAEGGGELVERGIQLGQLEPDTLKELNSCLRGALAGLERHRMAVGTRAFGDNQVKVSGPCFEQAVSILSNSREVQRLLLSAKPWFRTKKDIVIARLTLQVNEVSDNEIQSSLETKEDYGTDYMHLDAAIGQLKFIIYLTDVDEDTGPTCYVPGTNSRSGVTLRRLVGATVDNLGMSGSTELSKTRFMALPRFLRYKANFGSDLALESAAAKMLLENEIKVTGTRGTMFLFDPSGVHRGGLLKKFSRTILQVQVRVKW